MPRTPQLDTIGGEIDINHVRIGRAAGIPPVGLRPPIGSLGGDIVIDHGASNQSHIGAVGIVLVRQGQSARSFDLLGFLDPRWVAKRTVHVSDRGFGFTTRAFASPFRSTVIAMHAGTFPTISLASSNRSCVSMIFSPSGYDVTSAFNEV